MGAYGDLGDQADMEQNGNAEPRPALILAALVGGWIATAALTMVFVNSELAGEAVVLLIGLLTIGAGVWIVLRAVLLRHAPWSWSIAAFAVLASKPRPKYCATCSSR